MTINLSDLAALAGTYPSTPERFGKSYRKLAESVKAYVETQLAGISSGLEVSVYENDMTPLEMESGKHYLIGEGTVNIATLPDPAEEESGARIKVSMLVPNLILFADSYSAHIVDVVTFGNDTPNISTAFYILGETIELITDGSLWYVNHGEVPEEQPLDMFGTEVEVSKTITLTDHDISVNEYIQVLTPSDIPSGALVTKFRVDIDDALTPDAGTVDLRTTLYLNAGTGTVALPTYEKEATSGQLGMNVADKFGGFDNREMVDFLDGSGVYIRIQPSGASTVSGELTIKLKYLSLT